MSSANKLYFLFALPAALSQLAACSTIQSEWETGPKYESISRVSSIGTAEDITVVGFENGYFNNKQDIYSFVPGPHFIKIRYNPMNPAEAVIAVTTEENHFYIVEQINGSVDGEIKFRLKDFGTKFPYYCVPARILERTRQLSPTLLNSCINP